jgi:hypothetical protein
MSKRTSQTGLVGGDKDFLEVLKAQIEANLASHEAVPGEGRGKPNFPGGSHEVVPGERKYDANPATHVMRMF